MTKYTLAAPCSGVILYQWNPAGSPTSMLVGLGQRQARMGAGLGITFGGFAECGAFLNHPPGTIERVVDEAYREGSEELGAKSWHTAISPQTLRDYAQPLDGYLVRSDDANQIHAPVYYGMPITGYEMSMLRNLPETEERTGQILWATMRWRPGMTPATARENVHLFDGDVPISWSAFHHLHERECAFVKLALLASQGRLWNDRQKGI